MCNRLVVGVACLFGVPLTAVAEPTIRVPGTAGAKTTGGGALGGQAGTGIEIQDDSYFVRILANLTATAFTLSGETAEPYANSILQPEENGASFVLDASWFLRNSKQHDLGATVNLRLSPFLNWDKTTVTVDPVTMMTESTTVSKRAQVIALEAGGTWMWRAYESEEIPISLGADVLFSLRTLLGAASKDDVFLMDTLGSTKTFYLGADIRLKVKIKDVAVFAALSILPADDDVDGLTGGNLIFGVAIDGSVFQKAPTATGLNAATTPRDPKHRAHVVF